MYVKCASNEQVYDPHTISRHLDINSNTINDYIKQV